MKDIRSQMGRMFVFTRVVELGSFAAAGKELGLSAALVSTAVSELERSIGARLLSRTTRKLALTQAGERLLIHASSMVAEATQALSEAQSDSSEIAGTLRVTSTSVLVEELVIPVLARLSAEKGLCSELVIDDQRRDLIADGFDVGVRIGVAHDSSFSAKFLGETTEVIVGAPELIAGMDRDDIDAVRRLPWIVHSALPRTVTLEGPDGAPHALRLVPRAVVNTAAAQRSMLLAGVGVSMAIRPLVLDDLHRGSLVELLRTHCLPSRKIYALLPSTRDLPARTRAFVDRLAERSAVWLGRGKSSNPPGDRSPGQEPHRERIAHPC